MKKRLGLTTVCIATLAAVLIVILCSREPAPTPSTASRLPRRPQPTTEPASSLPIPPTHALNPVPFLEESPATKSQPAPTQPASRPAATTGTAPVPRQISYQRQQLRKQIAIIVGRQPNRNYKSRAAAVHRLGKDLRHDEIPQLLDFLKTKHNEQSDLSLLQLNSIKNDILDLLIEQNTLHQDLGYQIVAMYRDHSMDDVWRDYCVQHFSAYYERKWPATQNPLLPYDPEWRQIISAYHEAVGETDTTIAGTALIGLEMLSANHEEVSRQDLREIAFKTAANDASGESTRIAALQVCALTGERRILPVAESLAQDPNASTVLKLSASAATNQLQKGTP